MINKNGFEDFTFKKLAKVIGTSEAGIYRYFENKHRLLIYLAAWYWNWLEFQVNYQTHNIEDPKQKLKIIIRKNYCAFVLKQALVHLCVGWQIRCQCRLLHIHRQAV